MLTANATIDSTVQSDNGICETSTIPAALGISEFDQFVDRIIKAAEAGFNANLRDKLKAGELAYDLLMFEKSRKDKFKREETISLIETEILKRSPLSRDSVRVNAWIKAYQVAVLYFGTAKVKDFDGEAMKRLSYGILDVVGTLVQRDSHELYAIREGCYDVFRSILDSHAKGDPSRLYGGALRKRIDDHLEELKTLKKPAPPTDPAKIEQLEREREEAEREEKRARAKRAFKSMSEALAKNGIVKRSEIVEEMVRREFLTPSDLKQAIPNVMSPRELSSVVPVDAAAFAALCDAKEAVRFVETLVAMNKKDVFNAVMSKALDVSRKLTEKAAIDAKAESEGAALRVSA